MGSGASKAKKLARNRINLIFDIVDVVDDETAKAMNRYLGYGDDGVIKGKEGVYFDKATKMPMIGDIPLDIFRKMDDPIAFLSDPKIFPDGSVNARKQISKLADPEQFKLNRKASDPGIEYLRKQHLDSDGKVKDPSKLNNYFWTTFKAVGVTSAVATALSIIANSRSGCFLVNADGEEQRVDPGECTCKSMGTDEDGIPNNPNALACCEKCNNKTCPGDDEERGEEWVCPDASAPVSKPGDRCTSCGCDKGNEWRLCYRKLDMFDVFADFVAAMGKIIDKAGDLGEGILDAAKSLVRMIVIVVVVVIGLAVSGGITAFVVKQVKKVKGAPGDVK